MEQKITGRLENWQRQQATKKEFIVWGYIYDDRAKRWADGEVIHTSGIKNRQIKEGDIVTTRNSTYLLGKQQEATT